MSSKHNKEGGCVGPIIVISIIFLLLYTLVSNILNLELIYSHGFNQYIENIIAMDDVPSLKKSKINIKIYTKPEIKNNLIHKEYIKKNNTFKYLGAISGDKITWVSIQVIDGTSIINGYLLLEKTIEKGVLTSTEDKANIYFRDITYEEENKILSKLKIKFYNSINNKYNIKKESNPIKMQLIIDDKNKYIIEELGNDGLIYYSNNENKEKINIEYNNYLGDNYDAFSIQINTSYSIIKNGRYKRDNIYDLLSNNIFKFILFSFVLFLVFRKRKIHLKCSSCKSKKIKLIGSDEFIGGFLYENKDGTPDLRRKNKNKKLINIYYTYQCKNCNATFKISKVIHKEL